jgi:catechol 2,3-dioxygenase-like lactoylglutathione lyase family enzyme
VSEDRAVHTRVSEIAIFTSEVEATIAFYSKILGREPDIRSRGSAVFDVNGVVVFVHEAERAREDDHIAFSVPHLEGACDELRAKGVDVRGPDDFAWGRSAYALDPDGREVELHEPGGVFYAPGP